MRSCWLVIALAASGAGCGSKDDCQKVFDKLAPIMEKETGKKLPDDERAKGLAECRQNGGKDGKDEMMKCVLDASGDDAVKACLTSGLKKYENASKQTEARLELNKLMKNSKVYYITNSSYLAGSAATLPAEPCCKGPNGHCPVTHAWAKDKVWAGLDFQLDEPSVYQYSYTSDGKTVTATAVGDPSCSGTLETYTLKMTVDGSDSPQGVLTDPTK